MKDNENKTIVWRKQKLLKDQDGYMRYLLHKPVDPAVYPVPHVHLSLVQVDWETQSAVAAQVSPALISKIQVYINIQYIYILGYLLKIKKKGF